jgi:hypothetical protein
VGKQVTLLVLDAVVGRSVLAGPKQFEAAKEAMLMPGYDSVALAPEGGAAEGAQGEGAANPNRAAGEGAAGEGPAAEGPALGAGCVNEYKVFDGKNVRLAFVVKCTLEALGTSREKERLRWASNREQDV